MQPGAAAILPGAAVVQSGVAVVLPVAAAVQSENVAAGGSGSYSIERKRAGVWACFWLLKTDVGVLRRIPFLKKVGPRIVQVYFLLRLLRDDMPVALPFLKKVGPRIVQVRFLLRLSCDDMPAVFQFVK